MSKCKKLMTVNRVPEPLDKPKQPKKYDPDNNKDNTIWDQEEKKKAKAKVEQQKRIDIAYDFACAVETAVNAVFNKEETEPPSPSDIDGSNFVDPHSPIPSNLEPDSGFQDDINWDAKPGMSLKKYNSYMIQTADNLNYRLLYC